MTLLLARADGFGIRRLAAGDDRAPPKPAASRARPLTAAVPARLLVVEDDAFISMEIEDTLLGAGFKIVKIAVTAEEAIDAAVAAQPDLVLMDIRLLGPRDGVDAALEIRRRVDIPCLFASAHQDVAVRARAEAARPIGWLPKPFSPEQLLAAVDAALRALPG